MRTVGGAVMMALGLFILVTALVSA
jgi:hypothetical protein